MHVQMSIDRDTETQLERLLKELRLAHVAEEIELKKLLHRCTASGSQVDVDEYKARAKAHRAQGAKLTLTNALRVALTIGAGHANPKYVKEWMGVLNKVGVARGYGNGDKE